MKINKMNKPQIIGIGLIILFSLFLLTSCKNTSDNSDNKITNNDKNSINENLINNNSTIINNGINNQTISNQNEQPVQIKPIEEGYDFDLIAENEVNIGELI